MPQLEVLAGRKFGRLTVTATYYRRNGRTFWLCKCECGNNCEVWPPNLKSGHTRSCGCYFKDRVSTHRRSRTREYRIWGLMKTRCSDPNHESFKNYGGRGIRVCDRWLGPQGFQNFLADVGSRPSPTHTIDRIDNNKGYEPGNCRWATRKEQQRNTRMNHLVTYKGRTSPVVVWCEITGISKTCLLARLSRGWTPERALVQPVRAKRARRSSQGAA